MALKVLKSGKDFNVFNIKKYSSKSNRSNAVSTLSQIYFLFINIEYSDEIRKKYSKIYLNEEKF